MEAKCKSQRLLIKSIIKSREDLGLIVTALVNFIRDCKLLKLKHNQSLPYCIAKQNTIQYNRADSTDSCFELSFSVVETELNAFCELILALDEVQKRI